MTNTYSITYVLADVADDGRMALAAVSDDPRARDIPHALAFVRDATGRWSGCQLSNSLVGIHLARPGEAFDAVGIGIDGGVCEITGSQQRWSLMERGPEGPNTLVPLVTSRRVGDLVMAAGMQRRMYAGTPASGWSRIDDGLRIPATQDSIGGILTLDGTGADDVWCAGFYGEIWHRQGSLWEQIDSPTNSKLIASRRRPDGSLLFAGADGTAFMNDQGAWRFIEGLESYAAIGIENFQGDTYVAVRGGALYVLKGDRLERVEVGPDFAAYALGACDTSLLAAGPFGLYQLDRGGWHAVAPPIPVPKA